MRDNLYHRFLSSLRTPEDIAEKVDGWRKAGKLKAVEAPSFVGDVLEEIPGSIEGEGKSLVDLQGELRKKQKKEAAEKVVSKGVKTKALKDEREARKAERAAKKSLQEGTQNKAKRMKQYVPDRDDELVEPEKDTHMHARKAHTHTLTLTLTKAHMHANTHIYMLTQCAHIHTRVTHTAHTHSAHSTHSTHTCNTYIQHMHITQPYIHSCSNRTCTMIDHFRVCTCGAHLGLIEQGKGQWSLAVCLCLSLPLALQCLPEGCLAWLAQLQCRLWGWLRASTLGMEMCLPRRTWTRQLCKTG